jgi:hypothetical protein
MASDRARVSYDDRRQWRLVTRQQGRVALEADENEADFIASEELRRETKDIVGDCGTPDNGYDIGLLGQSNAAPNPTYDVVASNGTMYVGGVRSFSPEAIRYSNQPDWLDSSTDPDYLDPNQRASDKPNLKNELIYLLLKEQEVGAVEDTALRDVALGGPDSCQRTRLLQRIVRFATDTSDCTKAMDQLTGAFDLQHGLQFVDGKMRLESMSVLQVVFPPQNIQPDLCAPEATGGYLKPDNQLIRIKVVSATKGGGSLIWGFDDASFVYRVAPQGKLGVTTLKLLSRPIDEFHRPRTNQVVEVLRSAARLSSGAEDGPPNPSDNDFIAAADGFVTNLATDYDQDTQMITLNAAIPDIYAADVNPLFVRIWESQVTFQQNAAADLVGTGMQVIIYNFEGGPVHPGDFWMVAARPGAPTSVYPERYLKNPQPPEGPRMWICPLAVINWDLDQILNQVQDCRNQFEDLVDLSKRLPGAPQTWPVITEINWVNDTVMSVNQFNEGLLVSMSTPMAQLTVSEQTFQVTLDVPVPAFPARVPQPTAADMFRIPYVVRGRVDRTASVFRFRPQPSLAPSDVVRWLSTQNALEKSAHLVSSAGVRCRVVLKGDTILDEKGNPLDGEAFGVIRESASGPFTALKFPSGNGAEGGDFNSWFFIGLPTAPQVSKIDPVRGTQWAPNHVPGSIVVTFSGPVINVTDQTFTVADTVGNAIVGAVSVQSPTIAVFTPRTPFGAPPGAFGAVPFTYVASLDGSAITDPNGVQLQGDQGIGTPYTSSFDVLPLTGVTVDPAPEAAFGVTNPPTQVVLTFTSPVDLNKVDITNFTVTLRAGSKTSKVAGTIKKDANGLNLTFVPKGQFARTRFARMIITAGGGTTGTGGGKVPPPLMAVFTVSLTGSAVIDKNGCPIDGGGTGVPGSDFQSGFTVVL